MKKERKLLVGPQSPAGEGDPSIIFGSCLIQFNKRYVETGSSKGSGSNARRSFPWMSKDDPEFIRSNVSSDTERRHQCVGTF
jgi:hypothetical protein